jgi:hypothetical protein
MEIYDGISSATDREILKPFILNYFDYQQLTGDQIGRLAKSPQDYSTIFKRHFLESLPVTFVKEFNYLAIDSFVVNIPMKIGKYEMQLKLFENPKDTKFLSCYLYRDATVMTDCIPVYTVSLIDLEDCRVIRSYEVLKTDSYVSSALECFEEKNTNTGWGWYESLEKSELKEGKEYLLKIVITAFAPIL